MILLVGGPPGVGKTTLARELACRMGIPHFEMDIFKTWFECLFSKALTANISQWFWAPSERVLRTAEGIDPVIEDAKRKFLLANVPLHALCEALNLHEQSAIIEGWTIAPGYAPNPVSSRSVLLSMTDESAFRRRLQLGDPVSEDQVEPILRVKRLLESLARAHDVPVVDAADLETAVSVVEAIVAGSSVR